MIWVYSGAYSSLHWLWALLQVRLAFGMHTILNCSLSILFTLKMEKLLQVDANVLLNLISPISILYFSKTATSKYSLCSPGSDSSLNLQDIGSDVTSAEEPLRPTP